MGFILHTLRIGTVPLVSTTSADQLAMKADKGPLAQVAQIFV
jgi:hypothetical protein